MHPSTVQSTASILEAPCGLHDQQVAGHARMHHAFLNVQKTTHTSAECCKCCNYINYIKAIKSSWQAIMDGSCVHRCTQKACSPAECCKCCNYITKAMKSTWQAIMDGSCIHRCTQKASSSAECKIYQQIHEEHMGDHHAWIMRSLM
eukprot:724688-Pelagomonas_calceolata.AAC.2